MRRLSARPGAAGPFPLSSQGFSVLEQQPSEQGPCCRASCCVSQAVRMASTAAEDISNCSTARGWEGDASSALPS